MQHRRTASLVKRVNTKMISHSRSAGIRPYGGYRADALALESFMRVVERPRHDVSVHTSTVSVRRAG
jgi:hypothetical protein